MVLTASALLSRVHEAVESGDVAWLNPTLAMSAAALLGAFLLASSTKASSVKPLPCPASTLPVVGNTFDILRKVPQEYYDWLCDQTLLQRGQPWSFRVMGAQRMVVVATPALFEEVLQTQLDVFYKGPRIHDIFRDFFGRGIVIADGHDWFVQRKASSHLFSLHMMKAVMADQIRAKIPILYRVMHVHSDLGDQHGPVSMRRVFSHFTNDVFGPVGFGVEMNCLVRSLDGDHANPFMDAFARCAIVLRERRQVPVWLWKLKRALNIGNERIFQDSLKVVDDMLLHVVAESVKAQNKVSDAPKNLISLFLEHRSEIHDPTAQDKQQGVQDEVSMIRDMVMSFLFAGKDTTASTMSWYVVMMNRYPEAAAKVRDEIRRKLPSLMTGPLVVPDMDSLKPLTYLDASIRETLRLFPAAPVVARSVKRDTTIGDGTVVNRGDMLIITSYAQARLPCVWGEDAADFKPERWIDPETDKIRPVSPFKYSAFSGGPRICIGRKFAEFEMKTTLAMLMARFELTTVANPWTVTYDTMAECPEDGPLQVNVRAL